MKVYADMNATRACDVEEALRIRQGYSWLARLWRVSTPGAYFWCQKHVTEAVCIQLGDNGRKANRPSLRTADRLRLVALARDAGWIDSHIAAAMGISAQALHNWLQRHAPHGLAEALEDFSEESEDTPAQAA